MTLLRDKLCDRGPKSVCLYSDVRSCDILIACTKLLLNNNIQSISKETNPRISISVNDYHLIVECEHIVISI